MKLTILATGKTEEVADGYAMRLIEQGKAIVPEPKKPAAKTKAVEPGEKPAPAPEKKPAGKQGKRGK